MPDVLIELAAGTWVRPGQVAAIIAYHEHALELYGGKKTLKPQVKLHLIGHKGCEVIGWEFENFEAAKAFSGQIAKAINAVSKEEA